MYLIRFCYHIVVSSPIVLVSSLGLMNCWCLSPGMSLGVSALSRLILIAKKIVSAKKMTIKSEYMTTTPVFVSLTAVGSVTMTVFLGLSTSTGYS